MIDAAFEKRGEAMSDELNQIQPIDEVDMEYTLGDFPALTAEQIYANYDARDEVAQLRAELEKIRVALRGYSDSDLVSLAEATQTRLTAAELILATLCDMVLGEDAKDRSAGALVRAVGKLERERDQLCKMIGQMSYEADTQHAAALDLQAQRDAATNRAEQAEADAHLLAFGVQTGQRVEGLFAAASKYYVSPPPAQEDKKLGE